MKVTREVFERHYGKGSGVTLEFLREMGRMALPCSCGDPSCQGWQMACVTHILDDEIDALPKPYNNEARRLKLQVLGRED